MSGVPGEEKTPLKLAALKGARKSVLWTFFRVKLVFECEFEIS